MTLAGELDKSFPVIVLDDGVVESGNDFSFSSIQEVASACSEVIRKVLDSQTQKEVILCGWSYGGVVAVEVAKQLKSFQQISVKSIAMFDSPLRAAVVEKSETDDDGKTDNTFGNALSGDQEVMQRAASHFASCTKLLRMYHQRPAEKKPLSCPLFDIRPESSEYAIDFASVEELSSGPVKQTMVSGNHWTMIYNSNAKVTANTLKQLWLEYHI